MLKPKAVLFKNMVKPYFQARILLIVDEIFVYKKRSNKICCPVSEHLLGYQSNHQLRQFHSYRSDK